MRSARGGCIARERLSEYFRYAEDHAVFAGRTSERASEPPCSADVPLEFIGLHRTTTLMLPESAILDCAPCEYDEGQGLNWVRSSARGERRREDRQA